MNIKILSRNPKLYSTQRLIEAAKKRKHEVEVIDPLKCDIVIEKRRPNVYYKGGYIENVDATVLQKDGDFQMFDIRKNKVPLC